MCIRIVFMHQKSFKRAEHLVLISLLHQQIATGVSCSATYKAIKSEACKSGGVKTSRDQHSQVTSTFDLFGELDPVGVGERAGLLINVVYVQDLTHELYDRLGFIKRCGRY